MAEINYKELIYKNYVSLHNLHLHGESTIETFKKRFYSNEFYFGRHLPAEKGSKILDIGCGDGNLVFWFQQIGFPNTDGVDVSEEQIELGNKLGIKNLHKGDLQDYLGGKENYYDIIIARDVFEHFTKSQFLETLFVIKKALSRNGKLLIQVPNGEGIHMTSIFYGDITHENAYTESSLRQLALCSGFKKVSVYPVEPKSAGLKGMVRTLLWNYKVMKVKFWRYIERGKFGGPVTANLLAVVE